MTTMPGIFIFSEDATLAKQLLTPARELKRVLSQPVTALSLSETDAKDLSALGADKVITLQSAAAWPEALSEAISGLLSTVGASVFLVGGTLRGKHIAAHVAAKLNAGMSTDAKSVKIEDGKLLATRLHYAGLALCDEELSLPAVVTIPPRTFLPPNASAPAGAVETAKIDADGRVAITDRTQASGSGIDISAATKLVSVGRGFHKKEDLKLAEDLATAFKAEVSCSRPVAEDEHWLPIERYVGISGHTVKPDLYVAVGISGQVQHMVGARESKVIVAVNNDEHAPIFESADYGIVGDLYEVLPLLTAAVRKNGGR
jgi:electron transfer flavoprotein alpha subunit